jgi:hypothetical protein
MNLFFLDRLLGIVTPSWSDALGIELDELARELA